MWTHHHLGQHDGSNKSREFIINSKLTFFLILHFQMLRNLSDKMNIKDMSLPQDEFEGCDDDEWVRYHHVKEINIVTCQCRCDTDRYVYLGFRC